MGMRRPQGYAILTDTHTGKTTEWDTFTCVHCQRVQQVGGGQRPDDLGGYCMRCMANVCTDCADKDCVPYLMKLELEERRFREAIERNASRERLRRAVGV